jgi:uncharacterized membrane protein HdeD (DUF308 family)
MLGGMLTAFGLDYFLLVFFSAIGVLQVVGAYRHRRGLLFFKRTTSYILGIVMPFVAFSWFFGSQPRNVPDTSAGLDGNQQAILFCLGTITALIATLTIASLLHRSVLEEEEQIVGLDALNRNTYARVILKGIKNRWGHYIKLMKKSSSG